MPRRTPVAQAVKAASALGRAYGRNLESLTRAALRQQRAIGERMARAAAPPPPSGPGDWLAGMALGPAGGRRFRLYRPAGAVPDGGWPLMLMLHGCDQDANAFAASTRMNRLADRHRFLVLYPEQDRLANPHGCWHWFGRRSGQAVAEALTILAALDQACGLYRADARRVAVVGLSAGAGMAALLASRFAARFAAVAMHSGVAPGAARSATSALAAMRGERAPAPLTATGKALGAAMQGAALPPLLVIQGDTDPVVAPRNGRAAAEVWAGALGAVAQPTRERQRGRRRPVRVTEYRLGRRTVVSLCEVEGLGHAWSGGAARRRYADPDGPDASRMVWAFAARQFARRAAGA